MDINSRVCTGLYFVDLYCRPIYAAEKYGRQIDENESGRQIGGHFRYGRSTGGNAAADLYIRSVT